MIVRIIGVGFSIFTLLLTGVSLVFAEEKKILTDEEKLKMVEEMFSSPYTEEMYYRTDRLLLTATKHLTALKEAPAIATVITSDEIREIGARNILDVLERIPGIGITKGFYSAYEVEIRGLKTTRSSQVKLMVDGHSVNYPVWGGAGWTYELVTLDNVERIEVIRGPGSALYGSNAFSGIINIVTKKGNDYDGISASAGYGSFNTVRSNITYGNNFKNLDLIGSLTYFYTEGENLIVEKDIIGNSGETDDWRENLDSFLKLSWKDFELNTRYMSRRSGSYIGVTKALNDESEIDVQQFMSYISFSRILNEKFSLNTKIYYDFLEFTFNWELYPEGFAFAPLPTFTFPEGVLGSPSGKNKTYGIDFGFDYSLTETNTVTIGAEYKKIEHYDIVSFGNFDPITFVNLGSFQEIAPWSNEATREVWATYLQDQWEIFYNLRLTAGIRHDNYNDFGGDTNPRLGLVWNITRKIDFKFLYGQAFRAPNFEELYSINNPAAIGNPNLQPEEIETYELAFVFRPIRGAEINITSFYNKFTERIELDQSLAVPAFHNAGDTDIYGFESEAHYNWEAFEFYINHTWLNTEDKSTNDELPDIPTYRFNIGCNLHYRDNLSGNLNILHVGKRPRLSIDTRPDMPSYTKVDTTFIWKNFYKSLDLRLSIYNLLDEKYAYPAPPNTLQNDYPAERISFFGEIRYSF